MKNLIFTLLIFSTCNVFSQSDVKENKAIFNTKNVDSQKSISQWYNYGQTMDSILGMGAQCYYMPMFPDSNVWITNYGRPYCGAYADVLDLRSDVFHNCNQIVFDNNSTFFLDSIELYCKYIRNTDNTIVDTLLLEVYISNTINVGYLLDPISTNLGTDSVFYHQLPISQNNGLLDFPNKYSYKIPLTSVTYADTLFTYGFHKIKISTQNIPIISVNNYIVTSIGFIPGYSWGINDTISNKNYLSLWSRNESDGYYPIYSKHDYNISYLKSFRNSIWDSLFFPCLAFINPGYPVHHLIYYKIRPQTGYSVGVPIAPENFSGSLTVCKGQTITYSVDPIPNTTSYIWTLPSGCTGNSNTNTITVTYSQNAISGNIQVKGQNSCGIGAITSVPIIVEQVLFPLATSDSIVCAGSSTMLNVTGVSNCTFQWSGPGLNSNLQNPIINNIYSGGTYYVTVTDNNGCQAITSTEFSVFTPFQNESICLVTVDTVTWKNKVMWEKSSNVGTESFNVYKEVSTNIYNLIGTTSYDSASLFIDLSSVPESHGDKYKITVVDTCGNESDKSPFHKTMNLVISTFGSTMGLSWTPYEDESGIFVPDKYLIYKGTSPNNLQLLDSISGSFTSYNDNNVFDTYYYMVSVRKPGGCNVTGNNSESFSNKKLNFGSGINDYQIKNLSIYPNPANDKLNISIEEKATLEFINTQGQVVETFSLKEKTNILDISKHGSGVYTLRIKTDRGIAIRKLIKQ